MLRDSTCSLEAPFEGSRRGRHTHRAIYLQAYIKQEPHMKQEVKPEVKHEVKSEDADTDMADSEDEDGTPMVGSCSNSIP